VIKREKAYSIALVSTFIILFLIFVSSTASGLPEKDLHSFITPAITVGSGDSSDDKVVLNELSTEVTDTASESIQPAGLKITEIRIPTISKSEKYGPVIYGNRILWTDSPIDIDTYDVHMYDLSTSKETQITNSGSARSPTIYGNRVVYDDSRNGNSDIYMYNLSTKKETQITTNESDEYSTDFYGNKIVWFSDLGNNDDLTISNLYVYDLSTKKETQISTSGGSYNPKIYGNKIVWVNWRNGTANIYMYNLSTKKKIQITTSGTADNPAIYGNKIVWVDWRNGNYDIYMYDLSTKKETQITTNPSDSCYPAIYGDKITWTDDRNGNWDIYVYDLATGQECHTTDKSDQYDPEIYSDRIVWQDMRNGNTDIYMGTLSSASFSASPTTGKAPLTVTFTDKSIGSPTSWKWTFGDGTTSTKQNPTHKYSKVGKYTVSLTVKNAAGSNTVTKKDYIKVVTKPVASFSASPTTGEAPLNVAFTDKSTGIPTKWKWSFGDGKTSTQQNPKHQYLQEGKYKITLTVSNAAGSSTVTKANYIKVTTNTRPGIYSESK
jgi:beta propeller repeat protein